MGASDLWVYRSCYDRRGCRDGKRKAPTADGPRILCFLSLQTTGVRLLLVGCSRLSNGWFNDLNFYSFGMLFIIFGVLNFRVLLSTYSDTRMIGIFFLIFYLPSYGAIHGFSSTMIFYSISILNAASFVSDSLSSNGDPFISTYLKVWTHPSWSACV